MNFLEKIVLKNEKKKLLILILLLLATAYGVFKHIGVYQSLILGPTKFDNTQVADAQYLNKMQGINHRYKTDFIAYTNHIESTTTTKGGVKISEKESAHYYLAKVNHHYFIVQAQPNEFGEIKKDLEIEATLRDHDNFFTKSLDVDIYHRIAQDPNFAEIKKEIIPNVILYTKSQATDELILASILGIILLILSIFTLKSIRIVSNPSRHKTLRFANNNFGDLDQLSATLERENEQGLTQKVQGVTAYKDYITLQKGMSFELLRVQDLLMMYIEEKKQKILIFITLKTMRYLNCYESTRLTRHALSEKEANFIYTILSGSKPEMIFGYHEDLIKLWKKKPNELADFVAERKLNR